LVPIETYLNNPSLPTIDVRSPGEFQQGHIPGAINIPVFDDKERAEIGTLYKQQGRQPAVVRGLEIVGQKASAMLELLQQHDLDDGCHVHCWRGGMRSEGFTWFLRSCQIESQRIAGGYKSFRQAAHQSFSRCQSIIILGGATGSGKTKLLGCLKQAGQQVIDLEKVACHRGSAFGGIGQPGQPTVEHFENELFMQWRQLDPDRPVWLECESRSIGHVMIPEGIWNQMLTAPAVFLEVSPEQRVEFLMGEYGQLPAVELEAAMQRISKRLDGTKLKSAIAALHANDHRHFAHVALEYYDKGYQRSMRKSPFDLLSTLTLERSGQEECVDELIDLAQRLQNGSVHAKRKSEPAEQGTGDTNKKS